MTDADRVSKVIKVSTPISFRKDQVRESHWQVMDRKFQKKFQVMVMGKIGRRRAAAACRREEI